MLTDSRYMAIFGLDTLKSQNLLESDKKGQSFAVV